MYYTYQCSPAKAPLPKSYPNVYKHENSGYSKRFNCILPQQLSYGWSEIVKFLYVLLLVNLVFLMHGFKKFFSGSSIKMLPCPYYYLFIRLTRIYNLSCNVILFKETFKLILVYNLMHVYMHHGSAGKIYTVVISSCYENTTTY